MLNKSDVIGKYDCGFKLDQHRKCIKIVCPSSTYLSVWQEKAFNAAVTLWLTQLLFDLSALTFLSDAAGAAYLFLEHTFSREMEYIECSPFIGIYGL